GMQTSGAAKGDQGEFARIVTPFDGNDAQSPLHVGVYDAHDAGGKLFEGQARVPMFEPFRCNAARALEVEPELAAQKTFGMKTPHQQIRVGDGGFVATAITDRAG